MPVNILVQQGFGGCEAVRIGYSSSSDPIAATIQSDDEGRLLLVERTDPEATLKVVLQQLSASDPYQGFFARAIASGYNESFQYDGDPNSEDPIISTPFTSPILGYGAGMYRRYVDQAFSSSGYLYSSNFTRRNLYTGFEYEDSDENGEIVLRFHEYVTLSVPMSSSDEQGAQWNSVIRYLRSASTTSNFELTTDDGRRIDLETAAVSPGWSIVVYQVNPWGDTEIARLSFESDPSPVSAVCLGREGCEPQCVEIYRESDGAYICICKETAEPTLAPIQNRIAPKREKRPYVPPLDPPIKVAAAANSRKLRKLQPTLKRAQEEYDTAAAQVDSNPSESNLQAANLALNRWETAKREEADLEAAIESVTTESERASDTTIIPSRVLSRDSFIDQQGKLVIAGIPVSDGYINVTTTIVSIDGDRSLSGYAEKIVDNRKPRGTVTTTTTVVYDPLFPDLLDRRNSPEERGVVRVGNDTTIESEPIEE